MIRPCVIAKLNGVLFPWRVPVGRRERNTDWTARELTTEEEAVERAPNRRRPRSE